MDFTNQVAIVTGASSGIGEQVALRLVEQGARVVVFARSAEALAALERRHPERIVAVSGDVGIPGDVDWLFTVARDRFGPCQILINNAGMIDPRLLVDTTVNEWNRMFAVNLRGTFDMCRHALPDMVQKCFGTIVNVASISGVIGSQKFPRFTSYCAAKAGVIALTEALAAELAEHGIRVNCVSPGSVATKTLREAGPELVASMTPGEVAEVILFLASERSRPINGQNIHVYGP